MSRKIMKNVHRANNTGMSGSAGFRDAADLTDACHAVNRINRKFERELAELDGIEERRLARSKITLSPAAEAWLKREIPE